MRWQDIMALAGLSMVVLGTLFMFPSSADDMNWKYMLGGLALWLVGFVRVVGWLLWRWSEEIRRRRPFQNEEHAATSEKSN